METARPDPPLAMEPDDLPCGFCRLRGDGPASIVHANAAFFDLFGYTPPEAEAAGFAALAFAAAPDDWPLARAALTDGLCAGGPFQFSLRAVHRSGRAVWVLLRLRPAPDDPRLLDCAALDLTAEKAGPARADGGSLDPLLQHYLALGRRLERACYRTIMELSGLVVIEADSRSASYYASPTAEQFAFAPRLGRLGNFYMLTPELVHPDDRDLAEALSGTVRSGAASARATLRLLLADGGYRRCQLAINALRGVDGTISRSLVTVLPLDALP